MRTVIEPGGGAKVTSITKSTKIYFDYLLKGNQQVESFVLTLRVL